jgi:UDP-N-acetylglucosamine--N-acetylmuramyl-(pentapeptide) pyrophosphoryl-undecaprenol N-acetylglucosamine transferase
MSARARSGFAVCGGGTGGHIFPALAVAAELRRQLPDEPVVFLGKHASMEQELARRAGLSFEGLPAAGFARRWSLRNLVAVWKALRGFVRARRVLKKLGVRAVLGTGGFVCGPIVLAAATLKIPSVIHESNIVPGLTNTLLSRVATVVAVGQPQSQAHFPPGKTVVTGFPLRPGLNEPDKTQGCARFGLDPARPVLFIFPGSLAARQINRAVAEALPQLCRRRPDLQVLWMTGKADFEFARRVVDQFGLPVVTREFIYEVPEAYAAADLVLARAGAGTLAELSATGKPSLLVPYPYATDNHQAYNAAALADAGAAVIVPDKELSGDRLLAVLMDMFARLESLTRSAAAVRDAYPGHAAEELARILIELGAGKRSKA